MMVTTKEQVTTPIRFQVADIHKPILSVDTLTKAGYEVKFTQWGGGTIFNHRNKQNIAFQKRGGVYILEVLVAPTALRARGFQRCICWTW